MVLGVTVVDREGRTVASFDAPAVAAMLFPFTPALAPGQTAILRADVALAPGRAVPTGLAHRLAVSVPGDDGQPRRHIVTGARTPVERRAPLRIGLPLRTDRVLGLIAHAPVAIDGRLTHAQRDAIDFVRLNETRDSVFTGDPQRNEIYAIHGAEVVAVADGTIASVSDGQPENSPGPP
jgi:hypothetical protein